MVTNDGQSTTAQPQQTAGARSESSAVGSSGIAFFGAIGFGKDDARCAGSMSVAAFCVPMEVGLGRGGVGTLQGPGCCTRSLGLLVATRRLGAVILCGL
jgi:hypothetical protein